MTYRLQKQASFFASSCFKGFKKDMLQMLHPSRRDEACEVLKHEALKLGQMQGFGF